MTQALYLDYPGQAAAYTNPAEYLLGPDVLVAPVTTPGRAWRPPRSGSRRARGRTGSPAPPSPARPPRRSPCRSSRMPVFVKAGGIIPLQPSSGNAQTAGTAPITLQVHAGANGSSTLYDDAGTGLGYQSGQSRRPRSPTPRTLPRPPRQ